MNPFSYERPDNVAGALRGVDGRSVKFIAGGTNLLDLMKEGVERPSRLIDINHLPLGKIEENEDGGLRIGALVRNADAAYDERIKAGYPLLSSAFLAGASPQLRNAASTGGNLLQRTRCYYFYDTATPCNKREPGSGCSAIGGVNRIHAILGASDQCIATHPSDMCVGLAALNAKVRVTGEEGDRVIEFADFHRLPGNTPHIDTTLKAGELITGVDLPGETFDTNFTYLKLRDRLSYAFALVSVAVAMKLDGGKIAEVRVALGGVAHKPWRNTEAEAVLVGQAPEAAAFATFAENVLREAKGQGHNDFKTDLAKRAIMRALRQAAAGTPQSQTHKRVA
ncbi:MAG: xanthine dehydrogenase family protein subunit M [Pseudolabrys sp.]|nr:xanthine dehydrogenase family protein subunit M [Pseudolabrys sp.]